MQSFFVEILIKFPSAAFQATQLNVKTNQVHHTTP